MSSLDLKTFVISLPCAKDRQTVMREHLNAHGLEFEFIEAIDGRGFDAPAHPAHDTPRRRLYFGSDLKGGEIGCLLSHKKCYEKIVAENIPLALIFEDDVILKDGFTDILKQAMQHKDHFDLLRLINKPKLLKKAHKNLIALNANTHYIAKTQGTPGGAYAYLITKTGAEKLLGALERPVYLPIDTLMGQSWRTGLRSLILMPGATDFRKELGSFIGDERFIKQKPGGWMRLAYPFTRLGYKLYENTMRWAEYWRKP